MIIKVLDKVIAVLGAASHCVSNYFFFPAWEPGGTLLLNIYNVSYSLLKGKNYRGTVSCCEIVIAITEHSFW